MEKTKNISVTEQNRRLREKLHNDERKYKELLELFERVCESVGYDKLAKSWNKDYRNGWVSSWTWPLYEFLNTKVEQKITANIRNEAVDIVRGIILQLVVLGKYGIKLPFETCPFDVDANEKKKQNQYLKNYPECLVCGEKRITEVCHIVPRSQGGSDHQDNYFVLCPTHHHLFDHHRLSKAEWASLEQALEGKMENAIIYAKSIRYEHMKSQLSWRDDLPDDFKRLV
jgi:hypothetical protein